MEIVLHDTETGEPFDAFEIEDEVLDHFLDMGITPKMLVDWSMVEVLIGRGAPNPLGGEQNVE